MKILKSSGGGILNPTISQVEQREGEGFVKVFLSGNISFVKEKTIYEGKSF